MNTMLNAVLAQTNRRWTINAVATLTLVMTAVMTLIPPAFSATALPDSLKTGQPTFVEIYAPWCGTCKKLTPFVDSMERKLGSNMNFIRINGDEGVGKQWGRYFQIRAYPTYIIFDAEGRQVYNTAQHGLRPQTVYQYAAQTAQQHAASRH